MPNTDWRLRGEWLKNCNCAYGCPCDFNARPTLGHCEGLVAMHIREGHFGDVHLDGLKWIALVHFPGALHEGNGTLDCIVDERASPEQRDALLQIFSGQHSAEGTLFHILSLIVTKIHEPKFAPITFEFDYPGRRAEVHAGDLLDTTVEPIRNPVTDAEHRIQVLMPQGFEHQMAEVAHATISAKADITFDVPAGHSSLALVDHGPDGVVGYAA